MLLKYLKFVDNPAVLVMNDDDAPSAGNKHVMATLGNMSYMAGTHFHCYSPRRSHVLIGNYCQIAHDTIFEIGQNHAFGGVSPYPFDQVLGSENIFAHRAPFNKQQLIIGHDVWIGSGARIIKALKIGNGAIIGSGSVVTKDVPPYAIVGGNPARVIRYRFPPETIAAIDKIKWWYWPLEKIKACRQYMDSQENIGKFIEMFGDKNSALHFAGNIAKSAVNNSNIRQTQVPPHVLEKFQASRREGGQIFYFVPDLAAPKEDAAWPSVIGQFCQRYASRPHCLLLALRKAASGLQAQVRLLQEFMSRFPGRPNAMIFASPDGMSAELLAQADFFITTKEAISSKGIDCVETTGGRVLSGLEYDIFAYAKG